ncbi:hypothetical protein HDU97_010353 [Phlyctochytrium planicorne]|nr:hypothetical protein HDU97_010353 [Phlyctochytrium planicorne]
MVGKTFASTILGFASSSPATASLLPVAPNSRDSKTPSFSAGSSNENPIEQSTGRDEGVGKKRESSAHSRQVSDSDIEQRRESRASIRVRNRSSVPTVTNERDQEEFREEQRDFRKQYPSHFPAEDIKSLREEFLATIRCYEEELAKAYRKITSMKFDMEGMEERLERLERVERQRRSDSMAREMSAQKSPFDDSGRADPAHIPSNSTSGYSFPAPSPYHHPYLQNLLHHLQKSPSLSGNLPKPMPNVDPSQSQHLRPSTLRAPQPQQRIPTLEDLTKEFENVLHNDPADAIQENSPIVTELPAEATSPAMEVKSHGIVSSGMEMALTVARASFDLILPGNLKRFVTSTVGRAVAIREPIEKEAEVEKDPVIVKSSQGLSRIPNGSQHGTNAANRPGAPLYSKWLQSRGRFLAITAAGKVPSLPQELIQRILWCFLFPSSISLQNALQVQPLVLTLQQRLALWKLREISKSWRKSVENVFKTLQKLQIPFPSHAAMLRNLSQIRSNLPIFLPLRSCVQSLQSALRMKQIERLYLRLTAHFASSEEEIRLKWVDGVLPTLVLGLDIKNVDAAFADATAKPILIDASLNSQSFFPAVLPSTRRVSSEFDLAMQLLDSEAMDPESMKQWLQDFSSATVRINAELWREGNVEGPIAPPKGLEDAKIPILKGWVLQKIPLSTSIDSASSEVTLSINPRRSAENFSYSNHIRLVVKLSGGKGQFETVAPKPTSPSTTKLPSLFSGSTFNDASSRRFVIHRTLEVKEVQLATAPFFLGTI